MKDEKIEGMDEAANEAEEVLSKMTKEEIFPVGKWWQEWYLKAGHKRLGRILIKRIKELSKENE